MEQTAAQDKSPDLALLDRWARGFVHDLLSNIAQGKLIVRDALGVTVFGQEHAPRELTATLHVLSPRLYRAILTGGTLAGATTYINELWKADNLTAVIRIFARNRALNEGFDSAWAWAARRVSSAAHWLNRNSRTGSARNISAHYDLGNEFFQLFLDETMTYSAGIFETPSATMAEASRAKYDRICRKLALGPEDHVLEIGTGWGGFALHAAQYYGCRLTTTTISREQAKIAGERFAAAGLDGQIQLLQRDYRDLTGQYSKIVSIEMIEAVGHQYLGGFFNRCSELLAPRGEMLIQAITMADQHYNAYRKEADFIQRYIFPGSCLPSVTALCQAATKASDLRLVHTEDITAHYAETLRRWSAAFRAREEDIRKQGFDEAFIRTWHYYFAYCEGGFEERNISDLQIVFQRLDCRRPVELAPYSNTTREQAGATC